MLFTGPTKFSPLRSGSLVCTEEVHNTREVSLSGMKLVKGSMKLKNMKRGVKRGCAKAGK